MFRSSTKFFNNVLSVGLLELDHNIQNSVIQQFVRSHSYRIRKPVHLGTAKTKIFRVPERPVLSESEREELKNVYYNYHTLMRSIYAFMKEENLKLADGSKQLQQEAEIEDAHFAKCMEENDRWNQECAKVRNARIAELKLQNEMLILQTQRLSQIAAEEKVLQWEKLVSEQMELAKDFITEETLDDALRKAIETATDFNFAITAKGEVIKGSEPIGREEAEPKQGSEVSA